MNDNTLEPEDKESERPHPDWKAMYFRLKRHLNWRKYQAPSGQIKASITADKNIPEDVANALKEMIKLAHDNIPSGQPEGQGGEGELSGRFVSDAILRVLEQKDNQLKQYHDLQSDLRRGFLLAYDLVRDEAKKLVTPLTQEQKNSIIAMADRILDSSKPLCPTCQGREFVTSEFGNDQFCPTCNRTEKSITDGWVSVETALPEEGQACLIYNGRNVKASVYTDLEFKVEKNFSRGDRSHIEYWMNVTHWRPLPPAPVDHETNKK